MRQASSVVLLLLSGPFTFAEDPALKAAAAFYDGIRVETLPNGLTVVLKPVPGAPTVTTMVAYKVGAADEELSATGLSHYLEHLMFKGTDKLNPGDIDRLTMRGGGRNNAWTSEDLTTYHFDFPADRWETALAIEADRMRNLRIDTKHEFEQEKGAVIAELARNEDGPFDLELKAILPVLFGKSAPYGHPVIGEREHVHGATAAVIKSHYDRWYHPNNAVLVVAGGFDAERVLGVVKDKFGPIPAGKLPERKAAPPVRRSGPQRITQDSKFEVPRMVMGFNTVTYGDADEVPLSVVSSLLTGGKTGRLYRLLVEERRVASMVRAAHQPGRYPGWFAIEVELLPGRSPDEVEKLINAELQRLRDEPVGTGELQRAKQLLLAGEVFAKEGTHALAESLAVGVSLRGLDGMRQQLPALSNVTAGDVHRAAQKHLDPDRRVVVRSIPKAGAGAGPLGEKPRRSDDRPAAGGAFDVSQTQRVVLPNGLTLLLLENHRLPVVAVRAFVRGVRVSEPADQAGVASLTGALLEEGTPSRTGPQIAALIEDVGGEFTTDLSGVSLRVLSGNLPLGLDVVFDCLTRPAFPAEAFERLREQAVATLEENDQQPDTKAETAFRAAVYGEHPLGRPRLGRTAMLAKLTPESCRAFHAKAFVPERTVVAVVGDFDGRRVRAEVERLTAHWKPNRSAIPTPAPPGHPKEFQQTILPMPDAAQLHFYMGHPGIRRTDPDYFKLLVMDYVLGTGPGFTDRLSAKLRDRMGLAYTVSANITSSASEEPGLFVCYIGTFPDKFAVVKAAFLAEIRRLRDEPPAESEVADAKQYLLGSAAFRFSSSEQVAEQLLQIERFGLGLTFLDDFRRAVAAVTPAEVRDVARRHLRPDAMVLTAAGPIDSAGRPAGKTRP
jgi:zinc protease